MLTANEKQHTILVVDDEAKIRKNIAEMLGLEGFRVLEADGGEKAVELFRRERPSTVLLDLNMAGMDGVETLRLLRALDPAVPVIMVTGQADIATAVNAIKQGAYDFLTKPVNFGHLKLTLKHAVERSALERTVRELDTTFNATLEATLGPSEAMKKLIAQLRRVASSDYALLLQGETGTGKTFLANLIHTMSGRAAKPFIKVSIGSLQDTVVESELFGYEKGAFTGADRTKKGYFELAEGGTLFIDDLDNIPLLVQGKLLSIVEDKQVFRVGNPVPIPLNFRLIGATNADLLKLVVEKKFREDLFFRLSEVTLKLPPLRERQDDIVYFAKKFLAESCADLSGPSCALAEETLEFMRRGSWPGNLRQLKNVMKRAALLAERSLLGPEEVQLHLGDDAGARAFEPLHDEPVVTIADAEKMAIRKALAATGGQKLKTAAMLGIDYKTLVRKMKEYHIE
jgi:DNA-binding NtrC family response regulator